MKANGKTHSEPNVNFVDLVDPSLGVKRVGKLESRVEACALLLLSDASLISACPERFRGTTERTFFAMSSSTISIVRSSSGTFSSRPARRWTEDDSMKRYFLHMETTQYHVVAQPSASGSDGWRMERTADARKRFLQNLEHKLSITAGLGHESVHVLLRP